MRYADGARSPEDGAGADGLLATDGALDRFLGASGDLVGLDTEFMRERTFYPIAALYQVAGDAGIGLVDACAEQSFDGLRRLFVDPGVTKVMHSCSEDLEVIDTHLGVCPAGLVDTQVAHAFLTPEFAMSYAALVERYLGVVLPKQQTRSNWLRRPLSEAQLEYARADVAYLREIWTRMRARLAEAGRLDWFADEMASVLGRPAAKPEEYYLGMKRAWRMAPRQLAALRRLSAWRETEARRRDVPRARTVRDEHLVVLAEAASPTRALVFRLLPKGIARRYADELLRAHAEGLEDDAPPVPERPLSPREGGVVKAMRDFARTRAEALGIAPELLARRRVLEACVRHFRDYRELPGSLRWRLELVGERFSELLRAGLR